MVLDKEFLAVDKVGRMTEYILGDPKGDEGEGIAGLHVTALGSSIRNSALVKACHDTAP